MIHNQKSISNITLAVLVIIISILTIVFTRNDTYTVTDETINDCQCTTQQDNNQIKYDDINNTHYTLNIITTKDCICERGEK